MLTSITAILSYAADEQEHDRKRYAELIKQCQAPAKTAEEKYQEDLQKYPMLRATKEINDAIVQAEAKRFDKVTMQKRIDEQHKQFEEQERRRCTEVFRVFAVDIERTFQEHDADPLARYVIDRIKAYETAQDRWGFGIIYEWQPNTGGTRSLWCLIRADPKNLMAAYDTSIVLEKQ